ncbi:unnamed protein product, partial [Phaeothamnion confervicola]
MDIKSRPANLDAFAAARERWLDMVFADRPTPASAKIVARALSTHFNRLHFDQSSDLWAWPSTRTLDKKTGLSRNTVHSAIKNLEAAGWLEVYRSKDAARGRRMVNRYVARQPRKTGRSAPTGSRSRTDAVHPGAPDSVN